MLYESIKRLTKHSLIYALGPAVHKAIGFLLLPLVTAYIGTRENYGVVEMASVALVISGQLLGLNLLSGMTRYYYEYDDRERGELVTTTMLLLLVSTGAAVLVSVFFADVGAEILFGSAEYDDALVAVALILFCQTMGLVGLRYLQVQQRSVTYGVLTTVKLLAEVGAKVWFMVALGLTYMGVLYSVLVGEALLAIGTLFVLVRTVGLRFSTTMAKRLARFSYPLILSGLCMFALHQVDRWVIRLEHGLDETGLYGIGYKFGSVVNLVVLEAFGLIWFPYVYSLQDEGQIREMSRRILTYFSLLMIFCSFVVAVFTDELVHGMTERKFWEVTDAVPVILIGYVFWAVYQVVSTGFYLKERTGYVSVLVAVAAVLNIGLNFLLVPPLGYMGAAWATAITFFVLGVSSWLWVERVWPVGYELGRILTPLVLAVALWGVSTQLPAWSLPATLVAKTGIVVLLPLVLFLGGYLDPQERAKIADIMGALRTRLRG